MGKALVELDRSCLIKALVSGIFFVRENDAKDFFVAVLLAILTSTALAESETAELYVWNSSCCEITCFVFDIECCGWCDSDEPLIFQYLDADGGILGTSTIEDWCNGCTDEHFVTLETPVASQDICKILVTKPVDDCCTIEWMSVKALCELCCCRSSWTTLWKGSPCGWEVAKKCPGKGCG